MELLFDGRSTKLGHLSISFSSDLTRYDICLTNIRKKSTPALFQSIYYSKFLKVVSKIFHTEYSQTKTFLLYPRQPLAYVPVGPLKTRNDIRIRDFCFGLNGVMFELGNRKLNRRQWGDLPGISSLMLSEYSPDRARTILTQVLI